MSDHPDCGCTRCAAAAALAEVVESSDTSPHGSDEQQNMLLGTAVRARVLDVAAVVLTRWQARGTASPSTYPDAAARIARDCRLGTELVGRHLATEEGPTEDELTLLEDSGVQAAAHQFPWADITTNFLVWRSATQKIIVEEGARLNLNDDIVADAVSAVRRRADAGLIHIAERFDTERADLHRQLAAEQAKMTHLALHDPLTGLANRTLLLHRLTDALAAPRRDPVTVLFLDLDGFKTVNDRHGHTAGDAALVAVAHTLAEQMGPTDTVARYGGDEFVIVCALRERSAAVEKLVAALRAGIAACRGPDLGLSTSIGVAYARTADTAEHLLTRADLAMYTARDRPAHHHTAPGT